MTNVLSMIRIDGAVGKLYQSFLNIVPSYNNYPNLSQPEPNRIIFDEVFKAFLINPLFKGYILHKYLSKLEPIKVVFFI
jgi:hypothetical protein